MPNLQDKKANPPVFVLGMHRSGSSAMTEFLTLHGLYFGELEDSIGSNEENKRGFWERRDVRNLNDRILAELGCDWETVSSFDMSKIPLERWKEFVAVARRIQEQLGQDAMASFVIKEPRLCLTLPIWLEGNTAQQPLVFFIHRKPAEIAMSLEARNGFRREFSLSLWQRYVTAALMNCKDLSVVFIDFDDLISAPHDLSARISECLHSQGVVVRKPSKEMISEAIRPGLRHNRSDLCGINDEIRSLDEYLRQQCGLGIVTGYAPPALDAVTRDFSSDETRINVLKYWRVKKLYEDEARNVARLKQKVNKLSSEMAEYSDSLVYKVWKKLKKI